MSTTRSPRHVESVERWLHDQPVSAKEKSGRPDGRVRPTAPPPRSYSPPVVSAAGTVHAGRDDACVDDLVRHRDTHLHSRLHLHGHGHGHGHGAQDPQDGYIDLLECFLRVCSACQASGALGVGAVTYTLVHATSPSGGNVLDVTLNWVLALPVAAFALLWQLGRLAWLAWRAQDRSGAQLAVDMLIEAVLGVAAVICAILAGFQAAQHVLYNAKKASAASSTASASSRRLYRDIGPDIALVVLLSLIALTSFALLAMLFVEAHHRRRAASSAYSTSSSVMEIIR